MAEGVEEGDSHMEELVDHGLGMEETVHSPQRRPSLKESYHSDSLLAPDTDFMTDDRSSASGLDVVDRLTYLEQRMQMQEDEIQLLKMALADVLKRLNISEEHQAAAAGGRRTSGAKGETRSGPSLVPSSAAYLKKSTTLPSSSTARNYSPTPPRSGVWSPASSVKDSPGKTTKRPTSTASTASTASTSKKPQEGSKSKEPAAVSGGTSRVTHCKVTMQIYLSPLTRRTGSSEFAKSTSTVPANCGSAAPNNPQAKGGGKPGAKKTSPYKSPVKSPSQYFQICY
ncbi:Echinoderm microtubule-associated protein-like 1 [Dissostichus eleginoides]|uniref:Echinoderm microtubule-associated protein-like 1 n=1 Tax=Dissostichus eleginoides TaxID=100907 RepID=A0AAD9F556_DISEL|nr:Echinoderm microtubule-associated protein-like 1 [Dissostichus eleginoides]